MVIPKKSYINKPSEESPLFSPIDGKAVTESVAFQLEAAILNGRIKPGEKLPSERDLQGQFKTGRGVIREALRQLKQKGLIESRQVGKTGTYVKKVNVNEASEPLALLIKQEKVPINRLIEFRECIDRSATVLAISRAEKADIEELLSLITTLETVGAEDPPELDRIAEVDRNLNLILVRMTRNPIFEWIMKTIQMSFGSYDHVLYQDPYYREKTIQNWRETANAIAEREPMKALSFTGYHYVLLNRCIQEARKEKETPSTDL
jgi:GntR family transcriptional regulator, transcriptional repressor for pyruvate dehydrogenase complex